MCIYIYIPNRKHYQQLSLLEAEIVGSRVYTRYTRNQLKRSFIGWQIMENQDECSNLFQANMKSVS